MSQALFAAQTPDPRIAVAEARLVLLRDVAEFGMCRLRERYARPGEDPAIACMRLSRAIRCALILEGRIEVELASLKAGTWMPATPSPDPDGDHEPSKEDDMSGPKDPVERESPDRETFGHILKLPFKDAMKWLCKELGMDGEEFLRNHPLAKIACAAPAPAPAAAPAPSAPDEVREPTVEAIHTDLVVEEEIDSVEPDPVSDVDELLSQREMKGPAPQAWEGEGLPGQTANRKSATRVTPHPPTSGVPLLLSPGEREGRARPP